MNKTESYVTYEQAINLKYLGFDYPCYYYFTGEGTPAGCVWHTTNEDAPIDYNKTIYALCSMPTLKLAAKWLRSNGWHIQVMINGIRNMYFVQVYEFVCNGKVIESERLFDDYEKALSEGINIAIENWLKNEVI